MLERRDGQIHLQHGGSICVQCAINCERVETELSRSERCKCLMFLIEALVGSIDITLSM